MPATAKLLTKAINLQKTGCGDEARRLLLGILRTEPENPTAWFWYVETFEGRAGKIAALENWLNAIPTSRVAKANLRKLRAETAIVPATAGPLALFPQYLPVKVYTPPVPQPAHTPGESRGWIIAPLWMAIVGLLITLLVIGAVYSEQYGSLLWKQWQMAIEKQGLAEELAGQKGRYQSLQNELTQLVTDRNRMQKDFIELNNRYSRLTIDFKGLQDQYSQLNQQYATLNNGYGQLSGQYDGLRANYNRLMGEYNQLMAELAGLKATAIQPPYIFIHDRIVVMSFYRLDNTMLRWETSFDNLEDSIMRGSQARSNMEPAQFTTNTGEKFYAYDMAAFTDQRPFGDVMTKLYHSSFSGDAFIREVWHVVTQLSHYASEDGEVPRLPLETLLSGGGDCEDLAILLASMIRAAPTNWTVQLVHVDTDHLEHPQQLNHVIVYVHTGQRAYYIETTNSEVMEPYPYGVNGVFQAVR